MRVLHWNIQKLNRIGVEKQLHLENIAITIKKYSPNIVNLCEVSDYEQLESIKNIASTIDRKYLAYFVKGTDTRTNQNTCLLTTLNPIISPHTFTKEISKHYSASFKIGCTTLSIIGCHLIANPSCELRMTKRENQARKLRVEIDSLIASGHEVLIAGDLNDFDNDVKDANFSNSISNVLDIIKGKSFKTANELVNHKERYTYYYEGKNMMLDHILVSNKLFQKVKSVKIDHLRDNLFGNLVSNSDHDPIIIDFHI